MIRAQQTNVSRPNYHKSTLLLAAVGCFSLTTAETRSPLRGLLFSRFAFRAGPTQPRSRRGAKRLLGRRKCRPRKSAAFVRRRPL